MTLPIMGNIAPCKRLAMVSKEAFLKSVRSDVSCSSRCSPSPPSEARGKPSPKGSPMFAPSSWACLHRCGTRSPTMSGRAHMLPFPAENLLTSVRLGLDYPDYAGGATAYSLASHQCGSSCGAEQHCAPMTFVCPQWGSEPILVAMNSLHGPTITFGLLPWAHHAYNLTSLESVHLPPACSPSMQVCHISSSLFHLFSSWVHQWSKQQHRQWEKGACLVASCPGCVHCKYLPDSTF